MLWPFDSKKEAPHLGIDIGTTSVKLVKIEKAYPQMTKDTPAPRGKLLNYALLKTSPYSKAKASEVIQAQGVNLLESEVAQMLEALLDQLGEGVREVVMSVPAFSSFVDEILLPPMPDDEIPSAVEFEARSHVPVPISEVELTWQVIENQKKGNIVTLIAVPKDILFRYRNICNQLHLTLKALEVETFSIIRGLALFDDEPVLLIDGGARNTNISLVRNGYLRVSHNSEIAGEDITKVIAQGLGIPLSRAQELKFEQGLLIANENPPLAKLLNPLVDNLVDEIRRIIERENPKGIIKRLILTGGGASLKGFNEYLAQKLSLQVDIANPFATIEVDSSLVPILSEKASQFSVAAGLALY